MLVWSKEYETGVPLVDTQHRTLFQAINDLEALTKRRVIEKEEADQLINFLESYVISHFKFEESCMERFKCPQHEANKQAHAKFIELWTKFRAAYAAKGPDRELLGKLYNVAEKWIRQHICTVDMGLRQTSAKAGA